MRAVNMKNYKFGSAIKWGFTKGFGMYDEERNEFVSADGKIPYVLDTKKLVESCISAGFADSFKYRVQAN